MKKKWNEESIETALRNMISDFDLDHFPTRMEMIDFLGNHSLAVAMSKNGGSQYWSNKLGIPMKTCESTFGNRFELLAISEIEKNTGLNAEYTNCHFPYDILVDRSVKVDVKASKMYHRTEFENGCAFNLEKKNQSCDVFIFYCLDDDGDVYKRLIIPSTTLSGQKQVGINQQSKWNVYIDRWDIINEHADFFSQYKSKPSELKTKKRLPSPSSRGA